MCYLVEEKHHQRKLQVMPTASAHEVFALIDGRKNTTDQCKLHRVKTILGTSRSRMQQPIAACTRAQSLTRTCPCATCNWLLHPATIFSLMVNTVFSILFPLKVNTVLSIIRALSGQLTIGTPAGTKLYSPYSTIYQYSIGHQNPQERGLSIVYKYMYRKFQDLPNVCMNTYLEHK